MGEPQITPNFDIKSYAMKKLTCFLSLVLTAANFIQAQTWLQTRGPYNGEIDAIAVNRSNGFLVASSQSLIYSSADKGIHWQKSSLQASLPHSIAVGDNNVLFLGSGQGIFRSQNDGLNWTTQNGGQTAGVLVVKAVAGGRVMAGGKNGVIQYSSDNGLSWAVVHNGADFSSDVTDLAYSPGPNLFFAATAGQGVWKSANNGTTWTPANDASTANSTIDALHVVPQTGTLLARTYFSPTIFRSTNNGSSWSNLGGSPSWASDFDDNGSTAIFILSIFDGVFVSKDDGLSWTAENNTLPFNNSGHLAADQLGSVYAGFDDNIGIYRATGDANLNWALAGPTDLATYSLLYNADSQALFAGTSDSLFVTHNQGQSWEKRSSGLTDGRVAYLVRNANLQYAAGIFSGIFVSSDAGQNWAPTASQPSGTFLNAFAGNSDGYLLASTEAGLYRSANNGANWLQVVNGVGNVLPQYLRAADPPGPDHFMFGAANIISGVIRSTNSTCVTWNSFNSGFTSIPTILSLATSPDGQFVYAGTPAGVWRSPTGSAAWVLTKTGFPAITYLNIDALFSPAPQVLLASITGSGVFRSTNNGDTWQPYNDGLSNLTATSFEVDENGYVYAGTEFGGVFRSGAPVTATVDPYLPAVVVSPNPAGDWLYVPCDQASGARWWVADIMGRRCNVAGGRDAKGLRLYVADLPSGMYLLNLEGYAAAKFFKG